MPLPKDMTTSPAGLDAGKYREGFRPDAYLCSQGKVTIGHGATYRYIDGERVPIIMGDKITRAEAAELFAEQWREHESGIRRAITREITQNQFDVLADMAFQFGPNFLLSGDGGTTGLRDAINAGAWEKVDEQIARWHWGGPRGAKRRDPGVYTRALSRVCQWHALPWQWLYEASTRDTIKQVGGRVLETPFMKLDPTGAVLEMVNPETALARARAIDAAARAKAPAEARVPPTPAPSIPAEPPPAPEKPVITVKPPPGVVIKNEPETAPGAAPAPEKADPPPRPRKPVIAITEPYKPISTKTISLDDLHLRGIDPAKGAKPMTESESFWGLFWISAGNILFQAASRGLVIGVLPSWATFLIVDGLRDPVILGALTSLTVMLGAGIVAAPRIIKAGIKKLRRGRATASQLKY